MNPQHSGADAGDPIKEALIDRCSLTVEYVELIEQAGRAGNLSFGDAAVHVGLVSPQDLQDAISSVLSRGARAPESGLIERTIAKLSASRSVMVRPQRQVKINGRLLPTYAADERSEQLRALRTSLLLLANPGRQAHMMAVVSPCAGEGRSRLAAEMAISFSQLGRRTLLVDGDFRRPNQQQLFSAWECAGLGQALAHGQKPQMLSVEALPHLNVVTADSEISNPLELLSSDGFSRLVRDWRYEYEFVVFDTPPISDYSDGLAIATVVGGILVCSRAAATPHAAVKTMMRRISSTQARVLGAVLNKF